MEGSRPIESPHQPTSIVRTDATVKAGMRMAAEVKAWMEDNEDAFWTILGFVRGLQGKHVGGRVRDRVAVMLMANNVHMDDDPYKFANAKFAGIARYMALIDPSLVGAPLKFSDSVIDCYGLLPVSYLRLGA
ncbi:MAG: hypothetical protein IIZ12_06460 [Eggerthellaceae bacterium]|nr:hypothetical protein [Eggerthellaceae bacterium]